MSVSVSRSEGLAVMTLTSDPSSACPPLCQLLGALCYSPVCCSRASVLRPHRLGAQTVLGALWIITGLLQIGLGLVLICTRGTEVYQLEDTYCPVWLGVLFLLFGLCSILSERKPRPFFVLLTGILNLAGVCLSFTAIVWYATGVDRPGFYSLCYHDPDYYGFNTPSPTTASPEQRSVLERCEEARVLMWGLKTSVQAVLVSLPCLDLCVALSSAIISFKSLKQRQGGNKPGLKENTE